MIRHIVMFKLLPQAEGRTARENAALAVSMLEQLRGQIPTLRSMQTAVNAPDASADNYELALICTFDDLAGLDAYQNHPEHRKFGAFISKVRASRACIDFEE